MLGLFAASASLGDDDNVVKNGVVGNGFGIMARLATMATANRGVAIGFSYYSLSKSVFKRWIAKGNELIFPKICVSRLSFPNSDLVIPAKENR